MTKMNRTVILLVLFLPLLGGGCGESTFPRKNITSAAENPNGNTSSVAHLAEVPFKDGSIEHTADCDLKLTSHEPGIAEAIRQGEAKNFEHLGQQFLEYLVERGLVEQDGEVYNRRVAELRRIHGDRRHFKKYCRIDSLAVSSAGAFLCRFGNQGAPTPLQVKIWVLVRPQANKEVAWLVLDRVAEGSKYGGSEAMGRWANSLNNFPTASWVELKHRVYDVSSAHTVDTTDHVQVNEHWNGYVIKAAIDTFQMLAYKVPVMQKKSSGSTVENRTQIDVAFPSPGIMKVTPRTDSLTEEQRCWLGTHVIDSTAAGLR